MSKKVPVYLSKDEIETLNDALSVYVSELGVTTEVGNLQERLESELETFED